jgi:hypothetical protein
LASTPAGAQAPLKVMAAPVVKVLSKKGLANLGSVNEAPVKTG